MIVRYFPYKLTLTSPVVLTAPGGDPNTVESLDYVPGSAMRGATARVLKETSPDFHRLILSGDVRFLNAYLSLDGVRALPTPTSLRCEKQRPSVCHDLAGHRTEPDEDEPEWLGEQLARVSSRYLTLTQPTPRAVSVKLAGIVHHQRDRRIGRPTVDVGAIFRFDAIEQDQTFAGCLVCRGEDEATIEQLARKVQDALGQTVLLGRSRRAGYGGMARLQWGTPRNREIEGQRLARGELSVDREMYAVLASDYVGRDPITGQLDPSAWVDELVSRLGGRATVQWRFGENTLVGGYNRKWGLELPQSLAQRAGAVATLRINAPIPEQDYLAIEHHGLGERRIEGFGQVVFLESMWTGSLDSAEKKRPVARPTEAAPQLLHQMQDRLLRDALETRILERAADLTQSAQEIPTRSLLGRLRVPLRLPAAQALDQLRTWLCTGGLRRPARQRLERCRLQPPQGNRLSLMDWLQRWLDEPATLRDLLNFATLAQNHHFVSIEDATTWLNGQMDSTRVQLFDALFAALARRRNEGGAV